MSTAFYWHPDCLLHEMGAVHPECPARLQAIDDQLIVSRLEPMLTRERAPLAEMAALLRAHTQQHVDFLQALSPSQGHAAIDGDTALNQHSWQSARRAAGAAVAATDAVLGGRYDNAFCSVRPPGHHPEPNRAMGFCLLNNVVIAARHALDVHGLARVAVIDFDVHHGNGTERVFANDARMLMCGFFQHPFYPYTGAECAALNMVNLPMPAHSDGKAVRAAVERRWMPRLDAFRPEMVFVSAGFDAHREDELGGMALVEEDYVWLTERIRELGAIVETGVQRERENLRKAVAV